MHRCLEIDEILEHIISCFDLKASLLSLALSGRVFYEPAMNALWHDVHDFSILLRLLPRDAVDSRYEGPDYYRSEHWVSASN